MLVSHMHSFERRRIRKRASGHTREREMISSVTATLVNLLNGSVRDFVLRIIFQLGEFLKRAEPRCMLEEGVR
jgi:hypothetical protein